MNRLTNIVLAIICVCFLVCLVVGTVSGVFFNNKPNATQPTYSLCSGTAWKMPGVSNGHLADSRISFCSDGTYEVIVRGSNTRVFFKEYFHRDDVAAAYEWATKQHLVMIDIEQAYLDCKKKEVPETYRYYSPKLSAEDRADFEVWLNNPNPQLEFKLSDNLDELEPLRLSIEHYRVCRCCGKQMKEQNKEN